MTDETHGLGHNAPPAGDPFALQLEENNQDLWRALGDLERRRLRLPRVVETEEQATEITAWCGDAKKLMREFETRRVEVKEPYLKRAQLIDETFNTPRKKLGATAEDIEQRNGPYLRAKREREEAERREQARIAREAQEAAERAAREAREREEAAARERDRIEREAREAEARRVREEEEARQRAEAGDEPEAEEPEESAPVATTVDNEAAMRAAHQAELDARRATEEAEAAARKAAVQAERADKKAQQVDSLGKVSGAGANQKATMVWVGKIQSWPQVMQSLGPLAPFLNEQIIRDAIGRAARHPNRPEVPGVVYGQELEVKTTATRN